MIAMNYELWMRWESEAAEADAKSNYVDLSDAPAECESPIERRLAVFLIPYAEQWGFKVIPQFKHDRFRYDFAIEKGGKIIAVVECDGMEFHSTPEQRTRDVAKDLSARRADFVVFRYSGSNIYADAKRCAEEIIFRLWRHP
jgi:very-short-patch-repair endonuclease